MAVLQSLLDQKNAQAEAQHTTIEMLERKSCILSSELAEVKSHRGNMLLELQALKKALSDQSDMNELSQRLASNKQAENEHLVDALAAAQTELTSARSELQRLKQMYSAPLQARSLSQLVTYMHRVSIL